MNLTLSPFERLTLANQYRIIALLTKGETDYYINAAEVLERGYTKEYAWAFNHIFDWGELSQEKCEFVSEILNMYSKINAAVQDGAKIPEAESWAFTFAGFDGNNEAEYLSYTEFLMKKLGRYTFLTSKTDLNSHMPTLWKYRAMLLAAERSTSEYEYDQTDLQRIADAVTAARSVS